MCARYELDPENEDIMEIINEAEDRCDITVNKGTIHPTDIVPVLIQGPCNIISTAMVWGFPGYSDRNKPDVKPKPLINTKIETAAVLPTWQDSYAQRRCIIPTTGFFEWQKIGSKRIKYKFNYINSELVYLAGIYKPFKGAGVLNHFSLITTNANGSVSDIHHRMPLVLLPHEYNQWLTGDYITLVDRQAIGLTCMPVQ